MEGNVADNWAGKAIWITEATAEIAQVVVKPWDYASDIIYLPEVIFCHGQRDL